MDDMRAVMDAVGSERAALLGLSEGGPMSVLFATTYPERTLSLILCGTFATGTLDPDDHPAGQRWLDNFERVRATLQHWGEGHTLAIFAPSADSERERVGRGIFERAAASPQMARTLVEMVAENEVRDLLPSIRVPTLVLHREEEFIPVEARAIWLSTSRARAWLCCRGWTTSPSTATPMARPRRSKSSSPAPVRRPCPIASSRL